MKTTTQHPLKKCLIAIVFGALTSAAALADSYATLAGSGDSITIEAGETALVMAGAGTFAYSKQGRPCSFIRLTQDRKSTFRQSTHGAIPLVGPCKITVDSTDGFVGMRIVATGVRSSKKRSSVAAVPVKRSAVRP